MKVKISRPDGTIVEAEGTPEECAKLLDLTTTKEIAAPPPTWIPYPVVVPYTPPPVYPYPVWVEPTWIGPTWTSPTYVVTGGTTGFLGGRIDSPSLSFD